jgi:hypothetical protein
MTKVKIISKELILHQKLILKVKLKGINVWRKDTKVENARSQEKEIH